MTPAGLPEALLSPNAYPWRPATVELVETHISWVFLAGEKVVKVKRPVDLGFVDHTTLDRRRHSCEEEIRLNRRLTTGVYLGVVPVSRGAHGLTVDGKGPVVEWATLMRRMPAEAMLDARLKAGTSPDGLGNLLAERLVPFHRDLAPVFPGSADELARIVTKVVTDNLNELAAFPLAPVERGLVGTAMRRFVQDQPDLFRERAAAGWVRDGHGDLRCEHACLEPGAPPQIFDCVEFNPELRCVDVASDLAFLLMDLDRLGAGPAASELLEGYRAAGIDLPDSLLRLYWAHRALVRAKIWCLREPDGLRFADRAVAYLHQASRQVLATSPALICMTGPSGTGKSVIARAIGGALGVPVIASDGLRKELAGVTGQATAAWGEGIYTPEWTGATYAAMFEQADDRLAAGQPVLLDATFLDGARRREAARLAASRGVPFVLVETTCDDDEVRRRLRARGAMANDPSDAGTATWEQQRARLLLDPPRVPHGALHVVIDTRAPPAALLEPLFAALAHREIVVPRIPDAPLLVRK